MYFTSGSDRAFEQLMQTRPGADHFDSGEAGAPEDCGTCRFYRPHWKYQFCVYEECPYQPGKRIYSAPYGRTNDVIMDMVLIYMGAHDKGMVSFCEFQRQIPADLIGFFRRNFAGLKCLTEMVGDHIICTLISAGEICILSFGKKELCISKPGITLMAINEFSKIGFLRIFYIINNICNRSRDVPTFSYMQRHQSCGRYFRHPLSLIPIKEVIIAEKERGCLCAPPNLLNQI